MADENQQAGNSATGPDGAQQNGQGVQFGLQKLYLKDASFESPNAPGIFQEQSRPDISVNLDNRTERLGDDQYEVVLTVTVKATMGEKTSFLCEVQQAGAFVIRNVTEDQLKAMTATYCANMLFPFARQAVCDLVVQGGFPALLLNPIDFNTLYQQQLERERQEAQGAAGAESASQGETNA